MEAKETLHGKEPLLSRHVGWIPYHKGSAIRNKAAGYCGAFVRFAFCLPCDVREEVYAKPPTYWHMHSLQYRPNRPPRIARTGDVCQCTGFCGNDCINHMLYTECYGDATKNNNNSTNCHVGAKCGNCQIMQLRSAKRKPKREQGRGWGLIAVEKIGKGDLVQEYVGEVVDAETKEDILKKWARDHPNDPNFYVMSLSKGWFIDAREVANLSRFINHSCDPNCVLLPINMSGYMRNAIMACGISLRVNF